MNIKYTLTSTMNTFKPVLKIAGGEATNGTTSILDIEPKDLHQREPLIIGSLDLISLTIDTSS